MFMPDMAACLVSRLSFTATIRSASRKSVGKAERKTGLWRGLLVETLTLLAMACANPRDRLCTLRASAGPLSDGLSICTHATHHAKGMGTDASKQYHSMV